MSIRRFIVGLLLALTAFSALAMPRNFPVSAKRGVLTVTAYPQVMVDGQPQTMARGAKIISAQNAVVMPSGLTNNSYVVNYTVDHRGFIDKIWILTDAEQTQSR